MPSLAIIGSGISGLGAAWFLDRSHEVTLYEAADRLGGHTHTITVDEDGRPVPIDTGFMVFNHVTYPHLTRLFRTLDVPTQRTDMSFSVHHGPRDLEFCGSSLNHLFAQRRNLLRPSFYRLLFQIDRFNREAAAAVRADDPSLRRLSLADYVRRGAYGDDFFHLYLIPMSSAVWSTPPADMLRFPAGTLLRFFHNHGFLGLHTQHPWWTVTGGAHTYVRRLVRTLRARLRLGSPVAQVRRRPDGRVVVATAHDAAVFDRVLFACHAPAALALLGPDATPDERRVLSAFRYQPNAITLHTDTAVMPRTRLAWSSWNYRLEAPPGSPTAPRAPLPPAAPLATELTSSTHYWMNRLQRVSDRRQYFVSVEGRAHLDPSRVLHAYATEHPLFDLAAHAAQAELPLLHAAARGRTETYFAGAWQRYGFHEDGLLSALHVATLLLGRDPWAEVRTAPAAAVLPAPPTATAAAPALATLSA